MTGLLLITVVGVWVVIAFYLALLIGSKIPKMYGGSWHAIWMFFLLVPAPVLDEIAGKREFIRLCQERASIINMDESKVRGKTLYYHHERPSKTVRGQVTNDDLISDRWLPIWQRSIRYVDASGETAISYNELYADGGWISRTLNFNSSHVPYLFKGTCAPSTNIGHLFRSLQITVLDNSASRPEGNKK